MTLLMHRGYSIRKGSRHASLVYVNPRVENYVTWGPNFMWCLDGHDKFSQYGLQIYAAVDAYSRKIIWFYCGNSNRAQLSVLKQYLTAVKYQGLCPNCLRTDKGTETIMLADAHF